MPRSAICRFCGSENVIWQQTKHDKWYLAELVDGGARKSVVPHAKTCPGVWTKDTETEKSTDVG